MHQRAKKEKDIPTDQKQNKGSHETHFPLRALSKPSELKSPFFFFFNSQGAKNRK